MSPYIRCFSTFPPYFAKNFLSAHHFYKFPSAFVKFTCFNIPSVFFHFPPGLTMMHLCITQCTYWTPPHSFIHSFYFYSSSSSPLLLRGAPDTAWMLCRSFRPKNH